MKREYTVKAFWDEEARVWVAEGVDVPGLCTEADTMEQLVDKLKVMIPEMLEANGLISSEHETVPFAVTGTIHAQTSFHA